MNWKKPVVKFKVIFILQLNKPVHNAMALANVFLLDNLTSDNININNNGKKG